MRLRRYSGRYPGLPFVRFFAAWNEPNSGLFLSPQFDRLGRAVAPRKYAEIVEAIDAGVKSASPQALVAAGETAARGRDRAVLRVHCQAAAKSAPVSGVEKCTTGLAVEVVGRRSGGVA